MRSFGIRRAAGCFRPGRGLLPTGDKGRRALTAEETELDLSGPQEDGRSGRRGDGGRTRGGPREESPEESGRRTASGGPSLVAPVHAQHGLHLRVGQRGDATRRSRHV